MEAEHNNELTWIGRGALSLAACTEFLEKPSSLPSSNQLTWHHSICACMHSPSPRYSVENACHVPSLVVSQLTRTESQVSMEEMRLEWQVATELLIRRGRSSISFLKLTLLHFLENPSHHLERHFKLPSHHHLKWDQIEGLWRADVPGNEYTCLNVPHSKPWEFLTQEWECLAISLLCLHEKVMRPNLIWRGGNNMDLQEADEQHSLFWVNVIYVEAGFLGVVATFGMTNTFA